MNQTRRTTIAAPTEALATLESEARRRGTSLSAVVAEAITEKAAALRTSRRPRLGTGASIDGRRAADVTAEPIAEPPR